MKGQVPRKATASVLAGVLLALGYSVRRGAFEVSGRRRIGKGARRFHVRVDTYGQEHVPRDAAIDLHIDLDADIKRYHRSVAEGEEIAAEMERFVDAVRNHRGEAVRGTCPHCGKAFHAETLATHRKVVHGA